MDEINIFNTPRMNKRRFDCIASIGSCHFLSGQDSSLFIMESKDDDFVLVLRSAGLDLLAE